MARRAAPLLPARLPLAAAAAGARAARGPAAASALPARAAAGVSRQEGAVTTISEQLNSM